MKEVLLSIEDSKYDAFINFVKTLDFVKVSEDVTLEGIKKSLEEAKSMESEELSKKSVKKFLKGL